MPFEVRADSIGLAWSRAVSKVLEDRGSAFHLVVRIDGDDDPVIHRMLDDLLRERDLQSVATVANTLFPKQLAETSDTFEALCARYARIYPKLRRIEQNSRGTYFGRMIAYPDGDVSINQLAVTLAKLEASLRGQGFTSCYEVPIISPAHDINMRMRFPCLSHVSFHLNKPGRKLHLFAYYRNHYLIERAYGNYLGLRHLQSYIATKLAVDVGELAVVSGHAQIDGPIRPLRQLLNHIEGLVE